MIKQTDMQKAAQIIEKHYATCFHLVSGQQRRWVEQSIINLIRRERKAEREKIEQRFLKALETDNTLNDHKQCFRTW